MFDKNEYFQAMAHAVCSAGKVERSELKAFKIDDSDGIAKAIGFYPNMISKVDYFAEKGLLIQLVELSDLEQDIKSCHIKISEALNEIELNTTIPQKWKREQKKAIIKDAWKKIADEFFKKWSGSIAVIERLYRKTSQSVDSDPEYSLLIVCKNITDVKILDALTIKLNGQCGIMQTIQVCNTKHLDKFLLR